MSLTTDGVWKANVWASTVWANNVWFEKVKIIYKRAKGFILSIAMTKDFDLER